MEAFVSSFAISTADWQGKTCFVISFAGCNFNCPWCFVPNQLVLKNEFLISVMDIKRKIEQNLHFIDSVLFTGGEPALQRQALLSIARFARLQGLQIGIETNGAKPDTIKSLLFEHLLDFVALDIKAPFDSSFFEQVTHATTYFTPVEQHMNGIRETIKIIQEESILLQIRTTIIPSLMDTKEQLLSLASLVNDLHCSWLLQPFLAFSLADKKYKNGITSRESIEKLADACTQKYPSLQIYIKEI